MTKILQQYYRGISQQIRSEVDFINSLFEHQGVKGGGNETVLRELITKFIPKRYGVGTGVVIDQHGTQSSQRDIIIYDNFLYPSLLSLTTVHLFPVDLVYATIEVKTTLTSATSEQAIQNILSVRSLDFVKGDFADDLQFKGKDSVAAGIKKTTPPIGVVFAYNSEALQDETFKKWFTPTDQNDTPKYPSLVGCLDMGIVGFTPDVAEAKGSLTSVHPELGMEPECRTFPVVKKRDDNLEDVESAEDVQFLKISGDVKELKFFGYEGLTHPIKKIGKDYMAIDQSRVFLNFLLLFNELLNLKSIHPNINFLDTYLQHIDRFHFVC